MKERPILMSAPMVRALLEGRKKQTRRIVKPQPHESASLGFLIPRPNASGSCVHFHHVDTRGVHSNELTVHFPYGQPGDRLWVRETWADTNGESGPMISYRAGGDRFLIDESFPVQYEKYPGCQFTMWCGDLRCGEPGHTWKPPRFMPRWASRILLEITDVRVERLQDISEEDAIAEGAEWAACGGPQIGSHKAGYARLWETINGAGSWDKNPYVWAIEFKRIDHAK